MASGNTLATVRSRGLATAAAVVLASALPVLGTTWIRVESLRDLVAESRRAVLGTVTSVHHDYDDRGLHATFLQLRVEERLYGESLPREGQSLSIKLYGAAQSMPDGSRLFITGTPRYSIGERYLLLLLDDSPWGFTNTTGLGLGAFRIEKADGRAMARSFGGNRHAFGPTGLGGWLDARSVASPDRRYLEETDAAVPYFLLRRALLEIRENGEGAQ